MTAATIPTPSSFLEEAREMLPMIRRNAEAAEQAGRMTDEVVEAFRASKFRRMMVLEELGGGGLRIPEMIPVAQLLASADPATGWSLLFGMSGPMFGNMLPRSSYNEIFSDPAGGIAGATLRYRDQRHFGEHRGKFAVNIRRVFPTRDACIRHDVRERPDAVHGAGGAR